MNTDRHLILQSVVLPPSGEWTAPSHSWTVLRVGEGGGYWMKDGRAGELKDGDGFVASGLTNLAVRASQLSDLKLEFFLIHPPLLDGLLTVMEGSQLEQVTNHPRGQITFFAAGDPLGQRFSRLVHQARPESLPSRAALFQLWAQAVAGLLAQPPADAGVQNLRERFNHLLAQMPDAELVRLSLTQLAGQLHCSERHFSRLFREEFGVSLRARQTELRLQRARQLLTDSNCKISSVAFESGYRHLGLFNAMFKRRFGLTPQEWRQKNILARSSQPTGHADAGTNKAGAETDNGADESKNDESAGFVPSRNRAAAAPHSHFKPAIQPPKP